MPQFLSSYTEIRRRATIGQFSYGLDRRRLNESDAQPRVIVRPGPTEGTQVVKRECNDQEFVVSSPPGRTWAPGSVVFTARYSGDQGESIIAEPPPGRRGASLVAVDIGRPDFDTLRIIEADPAEIPANSTTAVTLTGIGFSESPLDILTPVQPDGGDGWAEDGNVTLSNVVWVDSETLTLDVTLGDVPAGYRISIDPVRA